MQAARPMAVLLLLQLGLALQAPRQFGTKFFVDLLNRFGFCPSYSQVHKYERTAALHQGTDSFSGSFIAVTHSHISKHHFFFFIFKVSL